METWAIPLAIVAVVWGVNSNLRGTLTPLIESILALSFFVLCGIGAWVSGWLAGIVAFFAATSLAGVAKAWSPIRPTRAR